MVDPDEGDAFMRAAVSDDRLELDEIAAWIGSHSGDSTSETMIPGRRRRGLAPTRGNELRWRVVGAQARSSDLVDLLLSPIEHREGVGGDGLEHG